VDAPLEVAVKHHHPGTSMPSRGVHTISPAYGVLTLAADEFIRRFVLHVLPRSPSE
jgi:hypothetical protein